MRSLREELTRAESRHIAIGHFNISNLEQLKAIADVGAKLNVPVIIGVSEGEREYIGLHQVRELVSSYNDEKGTKEGFWIFLNADHTHDEAGIEQAVKANFDAVLFDGGKLSFEENLTRTRKITEWVKKTNPRVLVEGELGNIGSASEIRNEIPQGAAFQEKDLTTPEEALRFVNETGVDLLAPAVGNIHGMPQKGADLPLNIERIKGIKEAVKIPLVLHGASGNTDEEIRNAIYAGISIVHISTEIRAAWRKGMEEALQKDKEEVAPYKLAPRAIEDMEEVIASKLRLFSGLE